VRVRFTRDAAGRDQVSAITIPPDGTASRISLGTPLLSVRSAAERRKHRIVPLAAIPGRVVQAVLAAEDHRFFDHPGIDPWRIAAAAVTNLTGDLPYLVGASTLTQQLVKNTMLTPGQTFTRKLHEQALSLLLERRLPKSRILELYLNEVYLGQHGSFAIHGVTQGARALFGKDLHNLSLGEAATMAGTIQAPQRNTPARHPARARTRRNVVLQAMVALDFITPDAAMSAAREPVEPVAALGDVEAPYFADLVGEQLESMLNGQAPGVRVETTLDVRLQRLAETAVRDGLRDMAGLSASGTAPVPQIALVAVDPRSGAIRALVGGNSYHGSQFNRASRARRQPGSVIKPFVYLAALERARHDPDFAFTPSSLIADEPTTFMHDGRPWRPTNFGQTYDGAVTARLALARSRNVAAVKVAERAGLAAVAELWAHASGGTTPPPYPSLALGTFEATPLEVAAAYTVLANGGERVPLHAVVGVSGRDGINVTMPVDPPRRVAGADSAFLVTQMLRSTFDVGTAAAARQRGFDLVAAGKTGTTDDLRDAWFAGFTPTLVTVVWVGHDDNRPLGLTGAQAALPIWTDFMRRAHEGRPSADFSQPPGVTRVEVDPVSGLLATARCPTPLLEAFRDGTVPGERCPLH
jgi:penicillin-binding protein 1B